MGLFINMYFSEFIFLLRIHLTVPAWHDIFVTTIMERLIERTTHRGRLRLPSCMKQIANDAANLTYVYIKRKVEDRATQRRGNNQVV